MSTNEPGNPNNYPNTIPLIGDQDPAAALVDMALEGLADRTAHLKSRVGALETKTGQLQALNFVHATALSGASWRFAYFDASLRGWVAIGDPAAVKVTEDQGHTWSAVTVTDAAGETCYGGAGSDDGSVISTNGRYIYEQTGGAFRRRDAFGSALTFAHSAVAYDPIRARWCVVGSAITETAHVRTSENRTTWTTRVAPGSFHMGHVSMAVKPSTGRIVLAQAYNGVGVGAVVTYSDDGGITWATSQVLATELSYTSFSSVAYDEAANRWLVVVGKASGGNESEIWESTDGVTWTRIKQLTGTCIRSIAALGKLWVGIAITAAASEVCYSLDGTTWLRANLVFTTPGQCVAAGGGGVLAMSNATAYVGLRAGLPPSPAFT